MKQREGGREREKERGRDKRNPYLNEEKINNLQFNYR